MVDSGKLLLDKMGRKNDTGTNYDPATNLASKVI